MNIETGIPIPKHLANTRIAEFQDALTKMKSGQSVVIPTMSERTAMHREAKLLGVKITTRKLDGAGYRVWVIGQRKCDLPISSHEYEAMRRRVEAARRGKARTEPASPRLQEPKADMRKAAENRPQSKSANESNRGRFRLSIALRFSTKRRRDVDGCASTIADALLAARRRLLDLYSRTDRDGRPSGD